MFTANWAVKLVEQIASIIEELKKTNREHRSLKRPYMASNGQVETDEQALEFVLPLSSLELVSY